LLPNLTGAPVTLQRLFSYVFRPIMWLIGIPAAEIATAAALMGTKTVLNEFIAYVDLAHLPPEALSARSRLIMMYALCGFANFGSLGILIGGMGAMVPERRPEGVVLGLRSILSGALATSLSGAGIGMLLVAWRAKAASHSRQGDDRGDGARLRGSRCVDLADPGKRRTRRLKYRFRLVKLSPNSDSYPGEFSTSTISIVIRLLGPFKFVDP